MNYTHNDPNSTWFSNIYYDLAWAKSLYPDHTFPGYTFNGGQMIVSPGKLSANEIIKFIDFEEFPYWTSEYRSNLPCVDQSLLNIILPLKEKRNEIRLRSIPFQLWSENVEVKNNYLVDKIKNEGYPYLIHWAGAIRHPFLRIMTRSDILIFFEKQYYKKIPYGEVIRTINSIRLALYYFTFGFIKRMIFKAKKITKLKIIPVFIK